MRHNRSRRAPATGTALQAQTVLRHQSPVLLSIRCVTKETGSLLRHLHGKMPHNHLVLRQIIPKLYRGHRVMRHLKKETPQNTMCMRHATLSVRHSSLTMTHIIDLVRHPQGVMRHLNVYMPHIILDQDGRSPAMRQIPEVLRHLLGFLRQGLAVTG